MKRRAVLKGITLLPFGTTAAAVVAAAPVSPPKERDLFAELGLRTFINAAGTYTAMTGSLMLPEVVQAIQAASTRFCMLDELQDKVGEKIAALVHAEAAVVTAGCFSAMTLGLAGVLTATGRHGHEIGSDYSKITCYRLCTCANEHRLYYCLC
jgi:hypothetical protein